MRDYEKMTDGLKRSAYTQRILEIVASIKKQNQEIDKVQSLGIFNKLFNLNYILGFLAGHFGHQVSSERDKQLIGYSRTDFHRRRRTHFQGKLSIFLHFCD